MNQLVSERRKKVPIVADSALIYSISEYAHEKKPATQVSPPSFRYQSHADEERELVDNDIFRVAVPF